MIAHKTKATMPGRLSLNALLKHRQITRLAASGQTLCVSTTDPQINCVRLTYGHRNPLNQIDYNEPLELAGNKHEQYSGSPEHQHCLGLVIIQKGCIEENQQRPALDDGNSDFSSAWQTMHICTVSVLFTNGGWTKKKGGISDPALLMVGCRQTTENQAVNSITGSNPVQLSDSDLDFLRCSDLSFRPQASRTQAEKLAPELSAFSRSTLASISSIRSCGNRIFFCADLAFTALVAIYPPAYSEGTPYQKNSLTCTPTKNIVGVHLEVEDTQDTAKPGSVTSTNRASDHNVTEAYIMACIQHTQTRPKYQYRFLALSAIGHSVIHITATTEREAREQSPAGCVMVFAGRLPVREGRYA